MIIRLIGFLLLLFVVSIESQQSNDYNPYPNYRPYTRMPIINPGYTPGSQSAYQALPPIYSSQYRPGGGYYSGAVISSAMPVLCILALIIVLLHAHRVQY